jgi:hypothetical protein
MDIPLYSVCYRAVINHHQHDYLFCYTDDLHDYMFQPLSGNPRAIDIYKIQTMIVILILCILVASE